MSAARWDAAQTRSLPGAVGPDAFSAPAPCLLRDAGARVDESSFCTTRPRVLCGQHFWGAVTIPPSLPPANSARASLGPGPAAQTRSSDSGSNFLRPACSSFAGLSALRSQGIPGSSGWILFGLTHHHQSCQLIRAEGDDV